MLLLDFENQGIRSAVWHVTETVEQLVSIHPNGIHLYEQSKSKFKSNSRIKEWLAVRVLLNHMLGSNAEIVYTENGTEREYTLRSSMKAIDEMCQDNGLVRCHRSYYINPAYVKVLRKDKEGVIFAEMDSRNVIRIPVSKTYYDHLAELLC